MTAKTHITFIHGIANKPKAEQLLKEWKDSLLSDFRGNNDDIDLDTQGITTSMIYWADVVYKEPLEKLKNIQFESVGLENLIDIEKGDQDWMKNLTNKEIEFISSLKSSLKIDDEIIDKKLDYDLTEPMSDSSFERIPLPKYVKDLFMQHLLKDVYLYLFNKPYSPREEVTYQVQDEIRKRVISALTAVTAENHIVISHSMGTVIIYDCLKRVADCPKINSLITIGSPLGLDEIQDMLRPEWSKENGYPEKVVKTWINIYDNLDPVAMLKGKIDNDFKKNGEKKIKIIQENNWGIWRHDISKYLQMPLLRNELRKIL